MATSNQRRIAFKRTGVWSPRRECVNCGKAFPIPLVKRRTTTGALAYAYSRRVTCSKQCANDLRSTAMERAHEATRAANPDRYREWVERDYAAMGRAAVAARMGPATTQKKGVKNGRRE